MHKEFEELSGTVCDLSGTVSSLSEKVSDLSGTVSSLSEKVGDLSGTVCDLSETVCFIKDHAVTHDELGEKLNQVKQEIFDHVDNKLDDLRGDLVTLTRKEDTKLLSLVNILKNRKVLRLKDTKIILGMEPFAQ
jgi:predicted nuclease with TOPRIM domain